jgi:hypothetical protein
MIKKLLAFTCLTLSIGANAALIDNGSFVTDDVAMVDYMKLSGTVGNSYNDVVLNDSLGFIADGWVVTSQSALKQLDFNDSSAYGMINGGGVFDVVTDNIIFGGQTDAPLTVVVDGWISAGSYVVAADVYDGSDTRVAVSLQRMSAVPLPAAAWLFGSALLGLGAMRRRKS